MLFNAPVFIFLFLPVTFFFLFILARYAGSNKAIFWLLLASIFFYGYGDLVHLPLLIGSLVVNYYFGAAIGERAQKGQTSHSRRILIFGIFFNLFIIGYFKYRGFFLENLNTLIGHESTLLKIHLPLAVSFFTFQQIVFLVDRFNGKVDKQPKIYEYLLSICFFPHLIAGPIVQFRELMPQFRKRDVFTLDVEAAVCGATVFFLGLFKKVALADQFAIYADAGFLAARHNYPLTFFEAWGATLSYTLQLYFDFSGYSDMAIGIAAMIGIRLPQNFNSPYKSASIAEFWHRWHITLSEFLRDYLYIPLGGNRKGATRHHTNLMITMLLGGMWHGAGWTFIFWGGLHGFYLVINDVWKKVTQQGLGRVAGLTTSGWVGRFVTLLAVIIAWVFFRADNFAAAVEVLNGMAGCNGSLLPSQIVNLSPALGWISAGVGRVPYLADGTVLGFVTMTILLCFGFAICLFGPNLHELNNRQRILLLIPTLAFTLQKIVFSSVPSPFIYFQF